MRRGMTGLAILVLLVAGACSKGNTGSAGPRPVSTAKLAILMPKAAATVDGKDVEVKLKLEGGTITKVVSKNVKPNIGHVHLRLDGNTITLLGSLDNHIKDVAAGPHLLEAEFVASDHLPFAKDILSAVNFTAK